MRHQGLADHRAVAGDEVEDAGRHAGGVDDLGQQEGVQRRDFRGFSTTVQPAASAAATLAAIWCSG